MDGGKSLTIMRTCFPELRSRRVFLTVLGHTPGESRRRHNTELAPAE